MEISDGLKDILSEVFHIGTGRAAASLSEMLEMLEEMNVPEIHYFDNDSLQEQQAINGGSRCRGKHNDFRGSIMGMDYPEIQECFVYCLPIMCHGPQNVPSLFQSLWIQNEIPFRPDSG